jgi:cytochrome c-type biogenesis protein CcmH/NrfF
MAMRTLLAGGLLALALAAPAVAAPPRTTLPDVEDEVMCPVCGTPLNLAEAPQADRQREFIRRLIAQGLTKEQIKARLVDQYGSDVLATPRREGFGHLAYLVPLVAGLLALGAVATVLVRRRGQRPSIQAVPAPLPPPDARRLDEDLARRDG